MQRWRRNILQVAFQEMAHLGTVNNLLTAIGGAPHFLRPNFPQPSHYFPMPSAEGGQIEYLPFTLQPFSEEALRRFIRIERPEGVSEFGLIAPEPVEYRGVGDLYRQIKEGFERIGPETLFEGKLIIGPTEQQDREAWSGSVNLFVVEDRQTAVEAIDWIIIEGEGTPEGGETSHYATFLNILNQLNQERVESPDFEPARPVVTDPLTRHHRNVPGGTLLTHPETLEVAELFNAVYGSLILMFMQYYSFNDDSPEQHHSLRQALFRLMRNAVGPLGEMLTKLPAGDNLPGQTAGPGFEFYTDLRIPGNRQNSWIIFLERLQDEARACDHLSQKDNAPPGLVEVRDLLNSVCTDLSQLLQTEEVPVEVVASALEIHFEGWFQCRLATNSDAHDEARGKFGWTFAVTGEIDLDRIIRLQNPVALRSHAPEIGVTVRAVTIKGKPLPDHPLVGAKVDLLDNPVFEGQNGAIATDMREPIVPFHLQIKGGGVTLQRKDNIELANPQEWRARRRPKRFVTESKEVEQITGVVDRHQYRLLRQAKLKADLAETDDPQAREALIERIEELEERGIAERSLGFQLFYEFDLRHEPLVEDRDNLLDGTIDTTEPWFINFWMGGWDADVLCGFMKGTLSLPFRSK